MNNKYPERLSFHEIRGMLGGISSDIPPLKIIDKDIAMLRTGHRLFKSFLQTNTPYIMEESRLGFIRSGKIRMTVNLIEHECCQGTFAFIGMGSILQIDELSDDFDLSGIMLSNERLKASLGSSMPAWCSNNTSYFTIRPQAEEAETVKLLFDNVWNLINKETFPDETLNGLVYALIHYYNYLKGMENETSRHEKIRNKELFDTFIRLVNSYGKHERKLSFYADKMCITTRYLGISVKQASGITAKEWIDRAVLTHAKVMLKYSSKMVAEIAYELNFPNVSFFCKYFKLATGLTPQEYRIK